MMFHLCPKISSGFKGPIINVLVLDFSLLQKWAMKQ